MKSIRYQSFTPYLPGSLKECAAISIPLMFAALSGALMLFLDRLVLAHYSLIAMNACMSAISIFNIFEFGIIAIAGMSEVFVGYYNGSQQYHRLAEPVWQMLIFSASSALVFWPLGLFGANWLLPTEFHEIGAPYFQWICLFGPVFAAVISLSGFYIGRGKVMFVTILMLVGNLVNLILNIILVFGVNGILEPMGNAGSAIASGIGQSVIAILLISDFLNTQNAKRYNTRRFYFDAKTFWRCVRLGGPSAAGHLIAFSAWAFWIHLLADISMTHLTVMSICLSIWSVLYFTTDGIQKGVTAITSNYLGANQQAQIPFVLKSAIKLVVIISLLTATVLVIFPHSFIMPFLDKIPAGMDAHALYNTLRPAFYWLWICLFFDNITWVFAGVFTALGNTRFIMFMEIVGAWLYCCLPSYWLIYRYSDLPLLPIQLMAVYTLLMDSSFALRYYQKKNRHYCILSEMDTSEKINYGNEVSQVQINL